MYRPHDFPPNPNSLTLKWIKPMAFTTRAHDKNVASLIKKICISDPLWALRQDSIYPQRKKHNARCELPIQQQRALHSKKLSSQGLNEISHIHRHLLHCSIVESLNIPKNSFVLLGNKVYSHPFPAKTTTSSNSAQNRRHLKNVFLKDSNT